MVGAGAGPGVTTRHHPPTPRRAPTVPPPGNRPRTTIPGPVSPTDIRQHPPTSANIRGGLGSAATARCWPGADTKRPTFANICQHMPTAVLVRRQPPGPDVGPASPRTDRHSPTFTNRAQHGPPPLDLPRRAARHATASNADTNITRTNAPSKTSGEPPRRGHDDGRLTRFRPGQWRATSRASPRPSRTSRAGSTPSPRPKPTGSPEKAPQPTAGSRCERRGRWRARQPGLRSSASSPPCAGPGLSQLGSTPSANDPAVLIRASRAPPIGA